MAVIVANLTDAQLAKVVQAGVPHVEIPAALVPRFRALVPQGMSAEDALIRLVKVAILQGEASAYDASEAQAREIRVRQKRADLATELGL